MQYNQTRSRAYALLLPLASHAGEGKQAAEQLKRGMCLCVPQATTPGIHDQSIHGGFLFRTLRLNPQSVDETRSLRGWCSVVPEGR